MTLIEAMQRCNTVLANLNNEILQVNQQYAPSLRRQATTHLNLERHAVMTISQEIVTASFSDTTQFIAVRMPLINLQLNLLEANSRRRAQLNHRRPALFRSAAPAA